MKDLTIIVSDYAHNNLNIELNQYFDVNFKMFPKLKEQIDIHVIAESNNKYEYNTKYINNITLHTNNEMLVNIVDSIDSTYVLFIDSQHSIHGTLEDIHKYISKAEGDLIFTDVGSSKFSVKKISKNNSQKRIFGLEKFDKVDKDKWNLNLHGTFVRKTLLDEIGNLEITNIVNSRLLFNQLLLCEPQIKYEQKIFVYQIVIIANEIDFDKKFTQVISDYDRFISQYFNVLTSEHLKAINKQLISDLEMLSSYLLLNPKIQKQKYRKLLLDHFKTNSSTMNKSVNALEKKKTYNLFRSRLNREVAARKFYTSAQQMMKLLPKKENKIVFINQSKNFDGELKYFTRRIVGEQTEAKLYFSTKQKIKGFNNLTTTHNLKYYYHLHTAMEVIYFDMVIDNFLKSEKQTVVEVYNEYSKVQYPLLNKKSNLIIEQYKYDQALNHIANLDEMICPNKYVANKFSKNLNRECSVRPLASERFFNKHQKNYDLINKLLQKYKLTKTKDYILYPVLNLNHHQYIDVRSINQKLTDNEVLIIVPLTNEFTVCNIHHEPYILFEYNTDVIELALICNGIIDNDNTLVDLFHKSFRKVIDINYDEEFIETVYGKI